MAYTITQAEHLEINSVPLATPAWSLANLFVMWSGPATRGQDRLIPGTTGALSNPRRPTVTSRTLLLDIFGDRDWEGASNADPRDGLWRNIAHLRANVTDPGGDVTATLHLPDGTTVSGPVHIESFELGGDLGPHAARAAIDITILHGALT